MVDQFLRRKKQQFAKNDRSLKQSWDKNIINLCSLINKCNDFYTTSSCSGRILILVDSKEKREDLFLFVSHDLISFQQLKNILSNIKDKKRIYFKFDPCILHIACRDFEKAQKIHDIAKLSGWKRCGIITSGKRVIVELNASDRIEFPIMNQGKILVDDNFLKLIVKESNKKLKLSWEKIDRLKLFIESQ